MNFLPNRNQQLINFTSAVLFDSMYRIIVFRTDD